MPESLFNRVKKETLAQVFSCEFCEISKNTFSYRTPLDDCFRICLLVLDMRVCFINRNQLPRVYLSEIFVQTLISFASVLLLVLMLYCKTQFW